jgi:tetratricopeptide (TPR) repeat protein
MREISLNRQWTSRQALILVTICLALGIAGGWAIRGLRGTSTPQVPSHSASTDVTPNVDTQQPDATQLKRMADAQAAPLLAKLRNNPNDSDTLSAVGNLYYDAQQYPVAVDYYSRVLQSRPSESSVRTDMATAYWYMGNVDQAIAEFNKALTYAPTNPNTLFNLGLVKWQAKHDSAGAIADWQKLLDANPNYEQKAKVLQMLSEVKKQNATKRSSSS